MYYTSMYIWFWHCCCCFYRKLYCMSIGHWRLSVSTWASDSQWDIWTICYNICIRGIICLIIYRQDSKSTPGTCPLPKTATCGSYFVHVDIQHRSSFEFHKSCYCHKKRHCILVAYQCTIIVFFLALKCAYFYRSNQCMVFSSDSWTRPKYWCGLRFYFVLKYFSAQRITTYLINFSPCIFSILNIAMLVCYTVHVTLTEFTAQCWTSENKVTSWQSM